MFVKILNADGVSNYFGFPYPLPHDGRPGEWTESEVPELGESGYHLTAPKSIFTWTIPADSRAFVAEYRGRFDASDGLIACESVRLVEEITPDWPLLPVYPILLLWLASQWREANPGACQPEWTDDGLLGIYLAGADLRRANLSGLDMAEAVLRRANLDLSNLSRANLNDADLTRADLYACRLTGTNLAGCIAAYANIGSADLSGANLSHSTLRYANLDGANLAGADLTGADMTCTRLTETNLTDANFTDAKDVTLPDGWEIGDDGLCRRTKEESK